MVAVVVFVLVVLVGFLGFVLDRWSLEDDWDEWGDDDDDLVMDLACTEERFCLSLNVPLPLLEVVGEECIGEEKGDAFTIMGGLSGGLVVIVVVLLEVALLDAR